MIDYFKELLMTHHLDIFMSGKHLGLNDATNAVYVSSIEHNVLQGNQSKKMKLPKEQNTLSI